MAAEHFSSKLCLLVLLTLSLLLVPACKKSSDQAPAEDAELQNVENAETGPAEANTTTPELVPLDIRLPKQMYVGTKQSIRVPDVEPLGKRPPFYAPVGAESVALGKPVTVSPDEEPFIGDIQMITDGDKEAIEGSYVELGRSLRSVTIDLQAEYEIYAILFWHYHQQSRVYFDVVVQVADDPDFITNVRTLFNNDRDNTSGLGIGEDMHYVESYEGKLVNANGVRARYVRLYSNGNNDNDYNHYIEVEVFAKPAK